MAYDNIRIVRHLGDIYDDSGYIHVDVEASFIVFQPQKGQKLRVRFTFTLFSRSREADGTLPDIVSVKRDLHFSVFTIVIIYK